MGQQLAKAVFQPPPRTYSQDSQLIWLTPREGEKIPALYIPRKDAYFTLLFSHGNAEDLGITFNYLQVLSYHANVNVFSYDYRGYGMSAGSPKEESIYQDIEAAFKHLTDVIGTPWNRIVPYGRSIGTGPTCHLSKRTAVRGIVLQSPMMSIYRIVFRLRFTLPGDLFSNADKIKHICCPVFIIHGTRDEIVPLWHGQHLHKACQKRGIAHKPFWIDGGDHNNLENKAFFEEIRKFLQHLEVTPLPEKLSAQAQQSNSIASSSPR